MMLPAQGPNTTLMEDFDILGLSEEKTKGKGPSTNPPQSKEADAKGGDYAGPPGDKKPGDPGGDVDLQGDAAAGHYTYVPVRGDESLGPDGKYGKSRGGAKNEHLEQVQTSGKMVPSFMIPTDHEIAASQQQMAEQAEADQLTRAWEVINAYFGEDEDGLNEDGLRGVINAFGFAMNAAVEDIAVLTSENDRLSEAVIDLNNILKESEQQIAEGAMPAAVLAMLKGARGGEDEDEDEDEGEKYKKKKKKDDDEDEDEDEVEESYRYRSNLLEDASLNSILDEVSSIGADPRRVAVEAQSRLIEGFETVVNNTADLVERIVDVIRDDEGLAEDEEISLDESDARLQIAQYFYGIMEDAQTYLGRLADGDVAFRVAEEDLSRLAGDVQKGISAMENIA